MDERLQKVEAEQQRQALAIEKVDDRLQRVEGEQRRQADALVKLDERQRKQGEDVIRLDGRLSGIDGRIAGIEGQFRQIPTLWQLGGLVFAIFGAALVLVRFASGH